MASVGTFATLILAHGEGNGDARHEHKQWHDNVPKAKALPRHMCYLSKKRFAEASWHWSTGLYPLVHHGVE